MSAICQTILSLLNRRGVWMTAVEIFASSPDYPTGDYVLADLRKMVANGLILTRRRPGSELDEYGLPNWPPASARRRSVRQILHAIQRLVRQAIATT